MNETVECFTCSREGKLVLDHGVVLHPGNRVCELPPRVEVQPVRVDRYPSPWRMEGLRQRQWRQWS